MRVTVFAILLSCQGEKYKETGELGWHDQHPSKDDTGQATGDDSTVDTHDSVGDDTEDSSTDTYAPPDCEDLPDPPTAWTYADLGSSEDFAFDGDGYVWHVDDRGALVKDDGHGTKEIIRPHVGSVAGTRFLKSGDLAIANYSTGSVDRISPDGSSVTLMSGIGYPNGLEVGRDGYIYVSDQTAGKVYQIDPETGDHKTVAEDLYSPNGVTFSPDNESLYVGSFGGGIVYRVDRDGDTAWHRPELYAGLPGSFAYHLPPCDGLADGDLCWQSNSGGPGVCRTDDSDGELYCEHDVDDAACDGLSEGDACTTTLLGETYLSACVESSEGVLFCPAAEADRMTGCDSLYETCSYDGSAGYCYQSFEDVYLCVNNDELNDEYYTCGDLSVGDDCVVANPATPDGGTCTDWSSYGYTELLCLPKGYYSAPGGGGGFDAIATDECGNVYIGEYVTAKLYRWTESGEEPETIMNLPSSWIPNMHFGVGVGGWEKDYLYIMDRGAGGLYGLDMNLYGHGEPYPSDE